jgi:hypothetical protein
MRDFDEDLVSEASVCRHRVLCRASSSLMPFSSAPHASSAARAEPLGAWSM